ncbi:MAG: nucleotidyltransferase domain-containing protein [Anaerolineae bacterium]
MVRRILVTGHPQKIILFGSRARGDAQPDSDYDLLLIELRWTGLLARSTSSRKSTESRRPSARKTHIR